MSRARFAELVDDLRRLDPQRVRVLVHMQLATVAEREVFDRTTANLAHAALCDEAARLMVRYEILASYKDRVSGVRPLAKGAPVAKLALVSKGGRS